MIKIADPCYQYFQLEDKIKTSVLKVLSSGSYVNGAELDMFEKQWARLHGVAGALGVANGTDALELALQALELPPHSEVIVPNLTFIATAEAVTRVGSIPVFCDVDPDLFVMRGRDLEQAIGPKTKAVIPVHLYGRPCPMDEILEVSYQYGLKVLEDCSQAHLASFQGQAVGSFGHAGTFSFYPSKNLGACGHAGAVVSNDLDLLQRIKGLANHGRNSQSEHEREGRNSQMDNLQAAILNCKLEALEQWTRQRQKNAQVYENELGHLSDVKTPGAVDIGVGHTYHQYVIKVAGSVREKLRSFLQERNIQTGVHYATLLSDYPFYSHCRSSVPTESAGLEKKILGLPVHEGLGEAEVKKVAASVRSFFDGL